METFKGVVALTYKNQRNPRFIILRRKKNWEGWETPKGHLEDENYEKTVRIELEEEAGVSDREIEEIEEMGETLEWTQEDEGEDVKRIYRAFLVRVDENSHVDVSGNPDDEHKEGYFFRYKDAKAMLTYEDNVELLEKAKEMID